MNASGHDTPRRGTHAASLRQQIIPGLVAAAALAVLAWAVLTPRQPVAPAAAPGTNTGTNTNSKAANPAAIGGDVLSEAQLQAIADRLADRLAERLAAELTPRLETGVARLERTSENLDAALRARADRALARLEAHAAAALASLADNTEPIQTLGPPAPAPELAPELAPEPAARRAPAGGPSSPKRDTASSPTRSPTASPRRATEPDRAPAPDRGRVARTINVNTASRAELELLPGIGPALAQRIINSRQTAGPFRRIGDLQRVRGIGPKTAETIAPHVRFN